MSINNINLRKMPLIRKGEKLLATTLNEPRVVLNNLKGTAPGSQRVNEAFNNFHVRQFKVKEVLEDDVLRCVTWDTIKEGDEDIFVALPFTLRRRPFDRLFAADSIERTIDTPGGDNDTKSFKFEYHVDAAGDVDATRRKAINLADSEDTEDQIIIPRYHEDDIIFGCRGIIGGVDVLRETTDDVVEWLDTNYDGRQWAKDANPPEEESSSS